MALELTDLQLSLHGRTLVPPFTAHVEPGQVLVLMGESGSGKSSLLAHLAGLLESPLAAQGRIRLDGREIGELPTEQRRVGLLFQDDLLFPHLSVLDNLLFALPRGERAARIAKAEQALAQAGLHGYGPRSPASLSGGQRARVSLLRTMLAGPRVLLLDEPFNKLDAALRQRMREFVWSQLREHAVCAVLVTHDEQDLPPPPQLAQCVRLPPLAPAVDA